MENASDDLHFLANVRNVSIKLLKLDADNLKLRVNHFELGITVTL